MHGSLALSISLSLFLFYFRYGIVHYHVLQICSCCYSYPNSYVKYFGLTIVIVHCCCCFYCWFVFMIQSYDDTQVYSIILLWFCIPVRYSNAIMVCRIFEKFKAEIYGNKNNRNSMNNKQT